MTCHDLALCIERMQPETQPRDVARLCFLLSNSVEDLELLEDEERLAELWQDILVRLASITDQHEAMAADLDDLSRANPKTLSYEQTMVLIRAIKVQSQVIQLYVGQPTLNTY